MIKANKITNVPPLILLLCSLVALIPEISAAQDGQPQDSNTAQHVVRKTEQQNDIYFSDSGRERTPAITAFPKYPSIARRDRIEGEATVCFTVNAKGQVIRPGIRSSSQRIFERPAMDAIRASTFEPLKPGEEKSNLKTCRVYRFKLAPIESADPAEDSNKET